MTAEVERLSWRESVAAQLYEIADEWSRGEMSMAGLSLRLELIESRIQARHDGESATSEAELSNSARDEMEWR
jgi:hypothetical protein